MRLQTKMIKSKTKGKTERGSVDSTSTKLPNIWKQNLLIREYSAKCVGCYLKQSPSMELPML